MKAMRSAYKVKNGVEPAFTNYAQTKNDKEPFVGTLDYIFLSDQWIVDNVSELPSMDSVKGPLPTLQEPSDHLLISAELR